MNSEMFEEDTTYQLKVELEQTKAELRQAKNLLAKIHKATSQFYNPPEPKGDHCPFEEILHLYHKTLPRFPKVVRLTNRRKAALRQRWAHDLTTVNDWAMYFEDVKDKPFLAGKNDRKWKADFDFLLRQDTIVKMQEGKYNA